MSDTAVLHFPINGAQANGSRPPNRRSRAWAQRVDRRRECMVVRVEGELDAAAYPEFRVVLDRAVHAGCRAVVVDLRAARFVSIRAAASLGSVKQWAAYSAVDVRVVAGRREIERVLDIAGVRPLFCHYLSMRDALDA